MGRRQATPGDLRPGGGNRRFRDRGGGHQACALRPLGVESSGPGSSRSPLDRGRSFDDTSRTLRALHHQVLALASTRVHFEWCARMTDPFERLRTEFAVCGAWGRLRGIARRWGDHPDYCPSSPATCGDSHTSPRRHRRRGTETTAPLARCPWKAPLATLHRDPRYYWPEHARKLYVYLLAFYAEDDPLPTLAASRIAHQRSSNTMKAYARGLPRLRGVRA